MNKYIKGCLVLIGVIITIIAIIAGLFFWSSNSRRKQAEIDGIKFSKECDLAKFITEQPEIQFANFKKNEINTLKFQILRKGKFIHDTLIKNGFDKKTNSSEYKSITIPYKEFLKTDTIVVITQNKLHYYISGYHHYAYLHYGMNGYLGSHECRFSDYTTINNEVFARPILFRKYGWINPEISKHIHKISVSDSVAYYSFAKKCKIKIQDAERILKEKRKNQVFRSTTTDGIEVGPKNSYYIYGEETESGTLPNNVVPRNLQEYVVKINCETGEYKRYKNYPFDD
ncbi:hypothetical protein [[Flexibacter] sp. ATCC 35103]|uniref:hypothetical protein n=1 Tax=[Flexibacter] sp. ATCC 35103 TaxID=1937528 RepID=UPI0009CBB2A7|nr:hypothetical protein [[Flexibacter] sp. ATCC 35103]OMQ13426.1 hypothetical protein BXU01_02805 [[Flexibacter] sp. ATCC 35103]